MHQEVVVDGLAIQENASMRRRPTGAGLGSIFGLVVGVAEGACLVIGTTAAAVARCGCGRRGDSGATVNPSNCTHIETYSCQQCDQ